MKFRADRRLLGLMLAPFALLTACVGLSPEEQAEYAELKEEVQRIQMQEIQPRQEQLNEIIEGKLVVNVAEIQAKVNQIRNERIEPLNQKVAALKASEHVMAAPGTRIELEELNRRLEELMQLRSVMEAQIDEHRQQLLGAKEVAASQLNEQIADLEIELKALLEQLEEVGRDTDLRAIEIEEALAELREQLESLSEDSAEAADKRAEIEALEQEWEAIHASEADLKAEIENSIEATEAEIVALRQEIEARQAALIDQFELLIHGLEMSLHDISEEKEDVVRKIHELELSAPEELEKTIEELEGLVEEIVTTELRPLIEQLNEATSGGDPNAVTREQLRTEIEEWLAKVAAMKARMNELTAKSFKSLLSGLDLGGLAALAGN